MKILLTGGGTGGHITPLLAVAQKLKAIQPDTTIIYVGEHGSKFNSLTDGSKLFDEQRRIYAGKFRRYHGESWLRRLFAVKTNLLNLRDLFLFIIGTKQSYFMLRKLRPDVILLKGSFVGVPVGIAAAWLHIPFVTHDSDALPGLGNRITGRWAAQHAVALPAQNYNYPPNETTQVGVLVGEDYQTVIASLQKQYRQELKLPVDAEVLFITGGSGGSAIMNQAIRAFVPALLKQRSKLHIVHQVGPGNGALYGEFTSRRLEIVPLLQGMQRYSGAADVIVTRAGANTLAEFGVQGKACIVVPNPLLTGGHQTKNAELIAKEGAVIVVPESKLRAAGQGSLQPTIIGLLDDAAKRSELGQKLQKITIPDASQKLAELLIKVGEKK
jgi:UDP-N-acetylglucosamine--N-acetylmuramyl-(pentapeptide) pyrophosphoryl-undecaprenol N-acetylglucosamine transferase